MTEQFIYVDGTGTKFYYKDKRMTNQHREDGPAVECVNGVKLYYLEGTQLASREFKLKTKKITINHDIYTLWELQQRINSAV